MLKLFIEKEYFKVATNIIRRNFSKFVFSCTFLNISFSVTKKVKYKKDM